MQGDCRSASRDPRQVKFLLTSELTRSQQQRGDVNSQPVVAYLTAMQNKIRSEAGYHQSLVHGDFKARNAQADHLLLQGTCSPNAQEPCAFGADDSPRLGMAWHSLAMSG